MEYDVHRFPIDMERYREQLKDYLNTLDGEVVSILPNIQKTGLLQIIGVSKKLIFLLIVEKRGS
ncbi:MULTISPECIES: hypothetical protein [unclassified Haladaptatus]|uniref:hypothetical protein n=1 Tax=unclassified Haladaptatus TaxID=2622732 RepID=UPI0023E83B6A|nr:MULTISPECIES: hypothetical protein [unclassified Haladaptatus]